MDIGRSFSFPTLDGRWISKGLLGFIVSVIPILNLASMGYHLEITKRTFDANDVPLPEWDELGNYWVRGLIVTIGVTIWAIPFYIIAIIAFVTPIVIAGNSSPLGSLFGICCAIPIVLIYFGYIMPILLGRYAIIGNFGSMFRIGEVFSDVQRGATQLTVSVAIWLIVLMICVPLSLCLVGLVGLAYFGLFVYPHMIGQIMRAARGDAVIPSPVAF